MEQLLSILPDVYRKQIEECCDLPDEIRITAGQPVLLRRGLEERWLRPITQASEIDAIIKRACRQSVYAHRESLCSGFIPLEGGHRIGLCGTGVMRDGLVYNLIEPVSLLIRVARDICGCADGLASRLTSSCLVIGPPCSGKTTMLRDLVRQLSDGAGQRVSLIDERGEVAAVLNGNPQFDVGKRTDVLSHIPKEQGIMMVLRTMNPQWIALDEITSPADVTKMERASYCGVKLLATAHADCYEDLFRRPLYRQLMACKIFRTIIRLNPDRTYQVREETI